MLIQHKQIDNRGMFFVRGEEDNVLAEIIYLKHDPDTMILERTEIADELRGENVGYQLVKSAVEHARAHHLKIVPMCPFAKAIIDKKPEFRDILAEQEW